MGSPTIFLVSGDLLAGSQFEGATRTAGAMLRTLGPDKVLTAAAEQLPQLVVFDLAAPVGDLAGKVTQLKALSPPPAVIAFGPHVQEQRLQQAADAGCDAVLTRGQFYRNACEVIARYASGAESAAVSDDAASADDDSADGDSLPSA
ncbi:MAG: hypothetical protein AAGF31_06775 [Planctomycetota bacterium]